MLAFDQFYIIADGGPRNSTVTAVYWIFSQSFVSFRLGYGAALSMVLLLILVSISVVQLRLLRTAGGHVMSAIRSRPARAAPAVRRRSLPRHRPRSRRSCSSRRWPGACWSASSRSVEARAAAVAALAGRRASASQSYENLAQFGVGIWTYAGNSLTVSACDRRR